MELSKEKFYEFGRLLLALAIEMEEGRGDDPHADSIRDDMDEYFYTASKEQNDSIGKMSVDLYDPETLKIARSDTDAFIQKYEV